jgi:hypothetical protein
MGFHRALALLAFAPLCAWFSVPAQAGCAHPAGAAHNGTLDYRIDSLRLLWIDGLGILPGPADADPLGSSSPHRPCSGPNCKQDSAPSQAPTPIPFSVRTDDCLGASRIDCAPRHVSALWLVEPSFTRIHAANTLKRPPRPSAS